MKHLSIILSLFLSFILVACSSISEEKYKKLKDENIFLKTEYSKLYREMYELTEYPKLTKFEKQGYDWAFSHLWESSGFISQKERKRIKKEYGDSALKEWNHGYKTGWDIFLTGSRKRKEKTSNKSVSPNG